eukprot:gene6243-11655_t
MKYLIGVLLIGTLASLCFASPKETVGHKCDTGCPFIYRQVCGSDGVTYDNLCLLKIAACKANENIYAVKEEPC